MTDEQAALLHSEITQFVEDFKDMHQIELSTTIKIILLVDK